MAKRGFSQQTKVVAAWNRIVDWIYSWKCGRYWLVLRERPWSFSFQLKTVVSVPKLYLKFLWVVFFTREPDCYFLITALRFSGITLNANCPVCLPAASCQALIPSWAPSEVAEPLTDALRYRRKADCLRHTNGCSFTEELGNTTKKEKKIKLNFKSMKF